MQQCADDSLYDLYSKMEQPQAMENDRGWCRTVADHDIVQVAVRLISASICQRCCRSSKFPASVPAFVSSVKQTDVDGRLLLRVWSRIESTIAGPAWRVGLMR